MSFLQHFIVGDLPPEPLPDPAQIPRRDLPPVVRELASKDRRFVVLLSLDAQKIYRGHGFTWFTHAGEDSWMVFWSRHDFDILTDDSNVVTEAAERQIETYELEHPVA